MRRLMLSALALLLAAPAPAARAQSLPPHAWLFGSWTGGLFPAPENVPEKICLQQPVVIFTRDVVLRATLTDPTYIQHVVETARTNPGRTEFRFSPPPSQTGGGLLGLGTAPEPVGFGCEDPNVLHVQRKSDNEITFPGCADFPYPLVRCH